MDILGRMMTFIELNGRCLGQWCFGFYLGVGILGEFGSCHCFWGDMTKRPLTTHGEPLEGQSKSSAKVHLGPVRSYVIFVVWVLVFVC